MTATATRTLFPAVDITARLLRRPIAPCRLVPAGLAGEVEIEDGRRTVRYALSYVVRLDAEGWAEIDGYRLSKADGTVYDIPEDLTSCDCGDATFRQREGGCRHRQALLQLREREEIA